MVLLSDLTKIFTSALACLSVCRSNNMFLVESLLNWETIGSILSILEVCAISYKSHSMHNSFHDMSRYDMGRRLKEFSMNFDASRMHRKHVQTLIWKIIIMSKHNFVEYLFSSFLFRMQSQSFGLTISMKLHVKGWNTGELVLGLGK